MANIFEALKKLAEEQIAIAEQEGIERGMKRAFLDGIIGQTLELATRNADRVYCANGDKLLIRGHNVRFTPDDAYVAINQMREVIKLRARADEAICEPVSIEELICDDMADAFGVSSINISDYEEVLALMNLPSAINAHAEKYLLSDSELDERVYGLLASELSFAHAIELAIDELVTEVSERKLIEEDFAETLSKRLAEIASATDEMMEFDEIEAFYDEAEASDALAAFCEGGEDDDDDDSDDMDFEVHGWPFS